MEIRGKDNNIINKLLHTIIYNKNIANKYKFLQKQQQQHQKQQNRSESNKTVALTDALTEVT